MSRETFLSSITGHSQQTRRTLGTGAIRDIIHEVAADHGILASQIIGRDRTPEIVAARHEAIFLAYRTNNYSMPQIGRAFGGRDHTTILNSIRKGRILRQKGN